MKSQHEDYQQLTSASDLIVKSISFILLLIIVLLFNPKCGQPKVVESNGIPWCGYQDKAMNESAYQGKTIFMNHCAQCHAKDMKTKLTGPALEGSFAAWKYDTAAYVAFIRNSQAMIKKKHPAALKTWAAFQPTIMPPFPNLTDDEIAALMDYIGR
jgi:cytochrome c551/c552